MSSNNSKQGLAFELQVEQSDFEGFQRYHPDHDVEGSEDQLIKADKFPLLAKGINASPEAIIRNSREFDEVIARALGHACFYCLGRSGEQECYIRSLPQNDIYRYVHAFEPWYRENKDRETLKNQLRTDQDAICIPPYKPSQLIDKTINI